MEDKKVSVIMSVYNETEQELRQSLESILNQSYKNIQFVIVLDNPGNTELKRIIEEYVEQDKRIVFEINPENKGLVWSLNRAFEIADGYYIARMDADDISLEERIQAQVTFLESGKADMVFAAVEYIDEQGKLLYTEKVKGKTPEKCRKTMRYVNCSCHPTWLFKREILSKIIQYRNVPFAEDYDFVCRVMSNGYIVFGQDKMLLQCRLRSQGISKSNKTRQDIMSGCIKEEFRKHPLSYSTERVLKKYGEKIEDTKYCHFIDDRYKSGLEYKKYLREKQYLKGIVSVTRAFIKHPSLFSEIYKKLYVKAVNK